MGFLDRFRKGKKPAEFKLDVSSRRDIRIFTVRDIEISVEKLPADKGVAEVHFRGGSEDERSILSTMLQAKIAAEFDYIAHSGSPVHGDPEVRRTAIYDEDYIRFVHPDDVSLVDNRKPPETKPPVTFEVLCHAAESIEKIYKSRILE
jgi:hypothetical protein